MARLACVIEDRPLPKPDAAEIIETLPQAHEAVLVATAVTEAERGHGIGTALIHALVAKAASEFDQLVLNVHIRNPAARLYSRTGFQVAGKGGGPLGVTMVSTLRQAS